MACNHPTWAKDGDHCPVCCSICNPTSPLTFLVYIFAVLGLVFTVAALASVFGGK